jgi:hypothetical protein
MKGSEITFQETKLKKAVATGKLLSITSFE